MNATRLARVSVVSLTLFAGILTAITLGGCPLSPQPQQPTNTTSDPNDVTQTPGTSNGGQTDIEDPRPVTTPVDEPSDGSDTGGFTPVDPDFGDLPGTGDGETVRAVSIDLASPLTGLQVSVGSRVDIEFAVTDPDGAVLAQPDGIRILFFRDDNADENPDDQNLDGKVNLTDAVYTTSSESFGTGVTNFLSFDTRELYEAGLLDASSFGRFVIAVYAKDSLSRVVIEVAPRSLVLQTKLPSVALTAPISPDEPVGLATPIQIAFTASDPDGALLPQPDGLKIIYAADPDGDGQADPNSAIELNVAALSVGENTYDFDPALLLTQLLLDESGAGQFVFGVRANDNVGRTRSYWSGGSIPVQAVAPTATITSPAGATGVRPGDALDITFNVADPDGVLVGQPVGVKLVIVRSDGGTPGAVVISEANLTFAAGTQTFALNTNLFNSLGLLDADGNGNFLIGVTLADVFGQTNTSYASWGLTVDTQKPTGYLHRIAIPTDNPPTKDGDPLAVPSVNPADDDYPTWITPVDELLTRERYLGLWFRSTDSSAVTIRVSADSDNDPDNGVGAVVAQTTATAGSNVDSSTAIAIDAASGLGAETYYYYVEIFDSVASDPYAFYAPSTSTTDDIRFGLTDRLVGTINVSALATRDDGAIFQGVNFNDLAGSSMTTVPDLDDDGAGEFAIVSRFGKPYGIQTDGIGFGEAYLLYGAADRLNGEIPLSGTGGANLEGIVMPGIRCKIGEKWSRGISDVAIVPDMDGDNLPEIVFSFPRVESLSLIDQAYLDEYPRDSIPDDIDRDGAPDFYQHPDLVSNIENLGLYEYSVLREINQDVRFQVPTPDPNTVVIPTWKGDRAQFTRGGLVIVSSHTQMFADRDLLNRKGQRLIDLHEVGQVFSLQSSQVNDRVYVRESNKVNTDVACPDDAPGETTDYTEDYIWLDIYFADQALGGFAQKWHYQFPAAQDPPLANARLFPTPTSNDFLTSLYIDAAGHSPCDDQCDPIIDWYPLSGWGLEPLARPSALIPWTDAGYPALDGVLDERILGWTGFLTPTTAAYFADATGGGERPTAIGARVLGQDVNDLFGRSVSADNRWLYMAAPNHTARQQDVPLLSADRANSGAVYLYQVQTPALAGGVTRSQLWIEPGFRGTGERLHWPFVDLESPDRRDYTMPTPHQYVVETIGSHRGWHPGADEPGSGPLGANTFDVGTQCMGNYTATEVVFNEYWDGQVPYDTGTAAYNMDVTPQVVGPHPGAMISFVAALGDVNGDGIEDFVVGSPNVDENIVDAGSGNEVGALFIVFGRTTGLEGDFLLEKMALAPTDPERLHGVLLKGVGTDARLARSIAGLDNFDGDGGGLADLIVGSESGGGGAGEAVVVFGSETLESAAGGWTVPDIVDASRAVRFIGEAVGDRAGENVADAGDVDGDGYSDILIAAPGAAGGAGRVYLIYGGPELEGEYDLAQVGTVDLMGVVFEGRKAGDELGGGTRSYTGTSFGGTMGSFDAASRGISGMGDFDGDGYDDIAISAILADPGATGLERIDAGEVYIIYGRRGDQE